MEAASGLWRSEDMMLLQFHMQRENAHDTVLKLGQLGMVQFQDLNTQTSVFQRDFATEVRRCDDMERKLRYMQDQISKAHVVTIPITNAEPETMNSLEHKIEDKEAEVRDVATQAEALIAEQNHVQEHLEVLMRDQGTSEAGSTVHVGGGGLTFITGVIPKEKLAMFERLIFRTTRGNSLVRSDLITNMLIDPTTHEEVQKCVFAVYFSSQRINEKAKKIAEACGATIYSYAERHDQLVQIREALQNQAESLAETFRQTERRQNLILSQVASVIDEWKRAVVTEKAVNSTLNLLQFSGTTVLARGWCPVSELDNVKRAMRLGELQAGSSVGTIVEEIRTKEKRPTLFKTNGFTSTFQGIVDAYGVARYKEVNPGVLTIVTFPYLFGLMYGDVGHGLLLTIFAGFLIFMEKHFEGKRLNEIFGMVFGGRYLLFMMGLFATYVGLLYNDMFGLSIEIFKSGYVWPELPSNGGPEGVVHPSYPNGVPSVKPDNIVVFGIDAAWSETENKLEFYNSFKMKCAVVVGVIQMTVGVMFSLQNHLYFNDMINIWFKFVPEIIFLTCTFGYMSLMIVIKWVKPWPNTNLAPSLLETMTNFFLMPGTVTAELYPGQVGVQVVLLLIAVSAIPVLLLGIPFIEKRNHEKKQKQHQDVQMHVLNASGESHEAEEEEEKFEFSDVMIHQVIHTIEYVLGCVSNTASYLRLWALSLAHAQLSDVFWNFALMMTVGLDQGSGVLTFIGFAVWLSATLGVLLTMESLSAFLHSLRLHWVEFQSKFYSGDGIQFTPFDLAAILEAQA